MPRVKKGGTNMWCSTCNKLTVCAGKGPATLGEAAGQHVQFTEHRDVNWFRRAKICKECEQGFMTAEVDESFLDELVNLRRELSTIKESAEEYVKESNAAASALGKPRQSLKVLQAMRIYDQA